MKPPPTCIQIYPLVLVGPAALALLLFIFLPVTIVFVLAFTDYSIGAPSAEWVGFENFADLFGSVGTMRFIRLHDNRIQMWHIKRSGERFGDKQY